MPSSRQQHAKPRKRRRTQQERREKTSGRLLNATIDLLFEKGYSRFRIADAAEKAKVSRGGQTHHFATKNDLIEAAIDQLYVSAIGQAWIDAGSAEDSEIIRRAARHATSFSFSKLYQVGLNLLISAGEQGRVAEGVRAIFARSRTPMEEAWISRIVQSGHDRKTAETVLGLLWSVQRAILVENRIGGDPGGISGGELDFTVDLLEKYMAEKARTTS